MVSKTFTSAKMKFLKLQEKIPGRGDVMLLFAMKSLAVNAQLINSYKSKKKIFLILSRN